MTREDEARRALRRLDEQSEKILGAGTPGAEDDDKIDILGKRIARVVSYGLAAFLIYWLWRSYF